MYAVVPPEYVCLPPQPVQYLFTFKVGTQYRDLPVTGKARAHVSSCRTSRQTPHCVILSYVHVISSIVVARSLGEEKNTPPTVVQAAVSKPTRIVNKPELVHLFVPPLWLISVLRELNF
ncbi:hypothetical protein BaRGS_00000565 [Batillaria attramentaria]|uniref:Uncharacterized protein n=1 Tax=Batillaria attramentaria TaxID=370345 RepID=A0ABD0MAD1_9CAEN